jgi:hypothetical protein
MAASATPTAQEQVQAIYEEAASRAAAAFEEVVSRPSFAVLLARSAENMAAVTRISGAVADLVLRNLHLAGRADITRLARQIARTEDKLERLLQEVEELRDELAQERRSSAPTNGHEPAQKPRPPTPQTN